MAGRSGRFPWGCLVVAGLLGAAREWPAVVAEPAIAAEMEEVVVTAPGTTGDEADGATVLRRLSEAALADAADVADALDRHFADVIVTEAQGNRAQKDVQLRGFVGSHLLGLPQGIALYQDGVRINEPFGDTVNWVLVPLDAMHSVGVVSGSPMFGLNALGGAIVAESKNSLAEHPLDIGLSLGSFGLAGLSSSFGVSGRDGTGADVGMFGALEYEQDDGWRDFSRSTIAKAFLRVDAVPPGFGTEVDASLAVVQAELVGNGAVPGELLDMRREAVFTHPDITQHDLLFFTFGMGLDKPSDDDDSGGFRRLFGNHATGAIWRMYLRSSDIDTANGDDSDFEPCADAPRWMCLGDEDGDGDEDGEEDRDDDGGGDDGDDHGDEAFLLDAEGRRIAATDDVIGATFNRSEVEQFTVGAFAEIRESRHWIWRHDLVGGLSADRSLVTFRANTQLGRLDETRRAVAANVFVGDAFTHLETETFTGSIYFSDAISLSDAWLLQIGGRLDGIELELRDQLGTALNGEHGFARFNTMLALRHRIASDLHASLRHAETNRAPSPVELTCADPDDPCRLPNGFLADPPLDDVVAKTWEITLRGTGDVAWHATAYRITNRDDILFISAGPLTNQGYFDNVGTTKRAGFELAASGGGRLQWFASYAYLDATFDDALKLTSPNHPLSEDGEITVQPGDRLPLLPRHVATMGVRYAVNGRLELGAHVKTRSDIHHRGDESNQLEPIDGFTILNLSADLRLNRAWRINLAIDNLTDQHYATFGLFGEADEVLGDDFEAPYFVTPGTPRSLRLTLEGSL